jgi:hypothetical protein
MTVCSAGGGIVRDKAVFLQSFSKLSPSNQDSMNLESRSQKNFEEESTHLPTTTCGSRSHNSKWRSGSHSEVRWEINTVLAELTMLFFKVF